MADEIKVKMSEFAEATQINNADDVIILQDGENKKVKSPVLESKIINRTVEELSKDGGISLNLVNLKGVVATYANLPTTNLQINDAYQVTADGLVYTWNGTAFQADGEGIKVQPDVNGVVEQGNTNAVSGGEVYNKLEPIDQDLKSIMLKSPNIFDISKVEKGQLALSAGNNTGSNNWISVILDVNPNTTYTLSGIKGVMNTSVARIFQYPTDGTAITSATIMSDGTLDDITFTTTANTYRVGINIGTTTNIGDNPQDNIFVHSLQLEEGNVATPYSPFGEFIMPYVDEKIEEVYEALEENEPIDKVELGNYKSVTSNAVALLTDGLTKLSPNIFDISKVEKGQLALSAGNNTGSNNWISVILDVKPNTTYTLSGLTYTTLTSFARIFQYPLEGGAITSETIMSDNTLDDVTFTTTSDTYRVGINIGSRTNIGDNPTDNEYVEIIQLEEGNIATPYLPYGSVTMPYVDEKIEEVYDYIDNFVPNNDNYVGILSPKTPYPPTINDFDTLTLGYILLWVDRFGRAYFKNGKTIYYSDDSGDTFNPIHTFSVYNIETVRDLENGELLIITQKTSTEGCKAFVTQGYNNGDYTSITLIDKFTNSNVGSFNNKWGIHVYKNEILLSEYGTRGEARYVYYSEDYGDTFNLIFDFFDYAQDSSQAHVHGSCIDPYRGWLWIVCGDVTNSSTYYSKDKGNTWITFENILDAQREGVPHQPVTVFPMPDCVVFLSDRTNLNVSPIMPSGAYRIDIPSGALNISNKDIKLSYRVDESSFLIQMGSNAYKNYYNPNQPTYFGFHRTSSGAGGDTGVGLYATYDGRQIYKIWETPILPYQGGVRFVAGADKNNNILVHYKNELGEDLSIRLKSQDWS